MLHYELPDIEQPGQVLQSSVILDGFNHLGEKVTLKLSICHCLSVIVSREAGSLLFLHRGVENKKDRRFSLVQIVVKYFLLLKYLIVFRCQNKRVVEKHYRGNFFG